MDIATAIGQVRRHATDVGHLDKLRIKMSFVSSYPPRVGLVVVVIVIKLRKQRECGCRLSFFKVLFRYGEGSLCR